ncbi:MNIO family bufferin maturase [Lysobacter xanthus]
MNTRLASPALPPGAGLAFKAEHFDDWCRAPTTPAFAEVHAENYLVNGGIRLAMLDRIAACVPLSIHGVGLSIGGASIDERHLDRVSRLLDRYPRAAFSEHLAWSSHGGVFFNDLLPIAYDGPTLRRVCEHVDRMQSRLRRRIALENPSTYVGLGASTMSEAAFLSEVIARTGCALLLDVTNVHVSCRNHGFCIDDYLRDIPLDAVAEVHLAGYTVDADDLADIVLIDTHGSAVEYAVWASYADLLGRIGAVPTLIEWDTDVPAFDVLQSERAKAQRLIDAHSPAVAVSA